MSLRPWIAAVSACIFGVAAGASPLDRLPEWRTFRSAYPYHIQTVALSRPDFEGKRLLIVSEPPANLRLADIAAVAPDLLGDGRVQWSRIGYDGAVADAIFELPAVSEDALRGLVAGLHIKLFGTAYKAYAVDIPIAPIKYASFNLDLHATTGTLAQWLVPPESHSPSPSWEVIFLFAVLTLYGLRAFGSSRQLRQVLALLVGVVGLGWQLLPPALHALNRKPDLSMRFSPLTGGESRTVKELFATKATGVYTSDEPGMVLWVVPRSSPLDSQRREARCFTLDSDVLLGAVADSNSLAIIGRERVVPIELLPPLRTETILLLASVKQSELSQSYERTHFFAGRTSASIDWAPIFLSDSLIDTEYGSLLNITDQLLKSWSMHGQIEYIHFPYPKPDDFPFPTPLMQHVKADLVTFNWNTKGAGYSNQTRGYDFFAWNRTGALPVDYLGDSDSELRSAEETGYNYFAKRSDPNLVRVVQYAQLYQMFQHYGITATAHDPAFHLDAPGEYRSALFQMLRVVNGVDDASIDSRFPDEIAPDIHKIKSAVDEMYNDDGEEALREVADAIAAPRLYTKTHSATSHTRSVMQLVHACAQQSEWLLKATGLTRDDAMNMYVRHTQRQPTAWIYTPSIVQSWGTEWSSNITGGHNLDSLITKFEESETVPIGQPEVIERDGAKVVLHNPADSARIGETVRTAARAEGTAEEMQSSVRAALAAAREEVRPMSEVLAFTANRQSAAIRGFSSEQVTTAIDRTGWWAHEGTLAEKQAALLGVLNSDGSHAIIVERTADGGYMLFDGPSRRFLQAQNEPAAIDALLAYTAPGKRSGAVRLHLRGFEPRAARGFTQSAELQMAGFGETSEIRATLETSELDAQKLKALLTEKYNFRQVSIKEVSAPFLTETGEMAVHVDAEVAVVKSPEPLHVRFRIAMKRGFEMTAEIIAQIKTVILNAFRGGEITADADGTLLLTKKIINDLQRINPDISYVHARIASKEVKDLYIVLNLPKSMRGPSAG